MLIEEGIEKAKEVRQMGWRTRDYHRAWWTLAFCYAYGRQWGYISPERGNLRQVQMLRQITDPNRVDVRVHVNHIRSAMRWLRSALNPQNPFETRLLPANNSETCRVVRDTGRPLLQKHLLDTNAERVYRTANEMRMVMGTSIIRRTIKRRRGKQFTMGDRELNIRDFQFGWANIWPHQVLRDPAANTPYPAWNEDSYGIEEPKTLNWIEENYGVKIKAEDSTATMGSMMDFQRELQAAGAFGNNPLSGESRVKGVMYYEFYFRDPKTSPGWPWLLPCYCDFGQDRTELVPLITKGKRLLPNPFQPPPLNPRLAAMGLPAHHFNCETQLQAPWSSGVPHLLMAGQDLLNFGLTWLFRLMQQGGGKIVWEIGTIENPKQAFSNRVDQGIPWRRQRTDSKAPQRLDGPNIPPAVTEFLSNAPDWMENALNREQVQRGITSKRGESAKAVMAKLEAAGMPLEDRRREDLLDLEDLMFATALDVLDPKVLRLDQAREMLGPDVPEMQVRTLLRQHPVHTIRGVKLLPGTLSPKTPAEVREEYVGLGTAQILTPMEVQRELANHGVSVNTLMRMNIEKQTAENDAMAAGQDMPAAMDDDHETHRYVVQLLVGSPRWHTIPPDGQERILAHSAQHLQASLELQQLQAIGQPAGSPPQQGTPSGPAVEAAMRTASGAGPPSEM